MQNSQGFANGAGRLPVVTINCPEQSVVWYKRSPERDAILIGEWKLTMKIGIPKEIHRGEKRVATTPEVAGRLQKLGYEPSMKEISVELEIPEEEASKH